MGCYYTCTSFPGTCIILEIDATVAICVIVFPWKPLFGLLVFVIMVEDLPVITYFSDNCERHIATPTATVAYNLEDISSIRCV